MKKLSVLLSVIILAVCMAGCNAGSNNSSATQQATTPATEAQATQTQAPTQAPPTQAPTEPATQLPTQAPTFAGTVVVKEAPTQATLPEGETEPPTEGGSVNENGEKSIYGEISGMGGRTMVVKRADGAEFEFEYSNADITGRDGFFTGSYVTVLYTGEVTGNSLGQAVSVTVDGY